MPIASDAAENFFINSPIKKSIRVCIIKAPYTCQGSQWDYRWKIEGLFAGNFKMISTPCDDKNCVRAERWNLPIWMIKSCSPPYGSHLIYPPPKKKGKNFLRRAKNKLRQLVCMEKDHRKKSFPSIRCTTNFCFNFSQANCVEECGASTQNYFKQEPI